MPVLINLDHIHIRNNSSPRFTNNLDYTEELFIVNNPKHLDKVN